MKDKNGNPLKVGDIVTHPNYILAGELTHVEKDVVKLNLGDLIVAVLPTDCTLVKLSGTTHEPYDQIYRKGFNEGHHKALQSPRNSASWWEEDQWQYDLDSAPKGILLLLCTSSKTEDGEEINFVVAMRVDGGWIVAHGRNGKIYDSIKCWMRFSIPKILDLSVRFSEKTE